ncbi:hypothetical protein [Thermomonas sp.]|uniref:hypothetical protein n=1 Tax=Thermomonas sp. TaxID=1971895 RepID=UPI0024875061|nr:hypothetical protein [Thermomonas sp.]MDI1252156.1 hypothetical protein [Thermomonas sp.]
MKSEKCATCQQQLSGRQRRFCSLKCKNADTNDRHQSYLSQQKRGLARKLQLVDEVGGRCVKCGYDRNLAALAWHHIDPRTKRFQLDLRSLSNRGERDIRIELEKCMLVCANCHAEIHSPTMEMCALLNKQGRD